MYRLRFFIDKSWPVKTILITKTFKRKRFSWSYNKKNKCAQYLPWLLSELLPTQPNGMMMMMNLVTTFKMMATTLMNSLSKNTIIQVSDLVLIRTSMLMRISMIISLVVAKATRKKESIRNARNYGEGLYNKLKRWMLLALQRHSEQILVLLNWHRKRSKQGWEQMMLTSTIKNSGPASLINAQMMTP